MTVKASGETLGLPTSRGDIRRGMDALSFTKMHGLGNDIVVLDGRQRPIALDARRVRAIADRHTGVGCDHLIVIEPSANSAASAFMRIHNADGGEVEACGNAARCVAALLMDESGRDRVDLETAAGVLHAERSGPAQVTINMGAPIFDWSRIPLAEPQDPLHVALKAGPLEDPVALSMGNPHAVFFVDDLEAVPLATVGPTLEHHSMFPERANIGIAAVEANDRIRLRVWERGVGITRACGTGACAATVAAHRRGLTARRVTVVLDGGCLEIEWCDDDLVLMTGPIAVSFSGRIDPALLA